MGFLRTSRWDNAQKGSVQALLAWGKWYRAQSRNRLSRIQHKMRGRTTPFDHTLRLLSLDQFSSVAELCPSLCDPMNRSTPDLPVCIYIYILAWRILWTEKPGRLQSLGSQTVGHDWASNTSCKRYFKGRVWEQKHISTKWEGPVQFLLSLKVAQTVKD